MLPTSMDAPQHCASVTVSSRMSPISQPRSIFARLSRQVFIDEYGSWTSSTACEHGDIIEGRIEMQDGASASQPAAAVRVCERAFGKRCQDRKF